MAFMELGETSGRRISGSGLTLTLFLHCDVDDIAFFGLIKPDVVETASRNSCGQPNTITFDGFGAVLRRRLPCVA